MPGREQEAVMSAPSIANPAPSERRLTGGILFLLAGLAALGALATNIILPAFPRIGAGLGVSSQELGVCDRAPSFWTAGRAGICAARFSADGLRSNRRVVCQRFASSAVCFPCGHPDHGFGACRSGLSSGRAAPAPSGAERFWQRAEIDNG